MLQSAAMSDDGPTSDVQPKSTAPEPETRKRALLERIAKRVGKNQLVKLAAHRGEVARAFEDMPKRMRLVANQTQLVLELIDDFRTGAYRRVSWLTIALATGAALYTVSPADIIPDALPFVGTLDDIAVVAIAIAFIRRDLERYCRFKGYEVAEYFGAE